MAILLFSAVLFLAYSNGANDNFKGVATLFGSGTTDYKKAINWATITTLMGSVTAIFLATELVKNFSGKGLVPDSLILSPEFATSIACGAAITVFLATRMGMPVSTTHSLVGALFGSGVMAVGVGFNFSKLGGAFLVPLIVSPLMAAGLSLITYVIFKRLRLAFGILKETCVCIGNVLTPLSKVVTTESVSIQKKLTNVSVKVASNQECVEVYQGQFMGINAQKLLDGAHYLSAGIVSFARGLNDTPKIVGLLLALQLLSIDWSMVVIAIGIAAGGLLNAKKVGVTMSKKITPMNHGQGLTANLITSLLVTTASVHGLPVSTTHVSVGSLFGIGTVTKKINKKVLLEIMLAWVLTLPIAALISALVYAILN